MIRHLCFAAAFMLWASVTAAQTLPDIPAPPDVAAPPADAMTSATGLASKVISPGTGEKPQADTDVVTVHYNGWTSDGRLFDSSRARSLPNMFPLNRVMAGWRECVLLMSVGETRRCWVPQPLAYNGQTGRPIGTVVFDIELLDTRRAPTIAPPDVAAPPADAMKTASGLMYKVIRPGTGTRRPTARDGVTVHYTGWTTDGKVFDSTVAKGMPVTLELTNVIRGWTEGMQLMVEGERTRFWIPQDLAYKGERGAPAGMLVFDIDLIKIEPPITQRF
jgi:peptidylprolyl isomerase